MSDDVKLNDLEGLINLIKSVNNEKSVETFFILNKKYFIRTVTMYIVGELVDINNTEMKFKNASWIADSGRFYNALKDGTFSEIEPFVNDVILSRGCIIDATEWTHDLPTEQK